MNLKAVLLPASSLEPVIELLQSQFGLDLKFQDSQRYATFEPKPLNVSLASEEERIVDHAALVFHVDDGIGETVEKLCRAGLTLVQRLTEGPHEWRAVLQFGDAPWQLVITQKLIRGG